MLPGALPVAVVTPQEMLGLVPFEIGLPLTTFTGRINNLATRIAWEIRQTSHNLPVYVLDGNNFYYYPPETAADGTPGARTYTKAPESLRLIKEAVGNAPSGVSQKGIVIIVARSHVLRNADMQYAALLQDLRHPGYMSYWLDIDMTLCNTSIYTNCLNILPAKYNTSGKCLRESMCSIHDHSGSTVTDPANKIPPLAHAWCEFDDLVVYDLIVALSYLINVDVEGTRRRVFIVGKDQRLHKHILQKYVRRNLRMMQDRESEARANPTAKALVKWEKALLHKVKNQMNEERPNSKKQFDDQQHAFDSLRSALTTVNNDFSITLFTMNFSLYSAEM